MGRNVPARGKNSGGVISWAATRRVKACCNRISYGLTLPRRGSGPFLVFSCSKTAASFLPAASPFPSRVRGISALSQGTHGLAKLEPRSEEPWLLVSLSMDHGVWQSHGLAGPFDARHSHPIRKPEEHPSSTSLRPRVTKYLTKPHYGIIRASDCS